MNKAKKAPPAARHTPVQYALIELPRPGSREIRMRETGGTWLQRNESENRAEETT